MENVRYSVLELGTVSGVLRGVFLPKLDNLSLEYVYSFIVH